MSLFHGQHLLGTYFECEEAALEDVAALGAAMCRGVVAAGATVVESARHIFPPNGVTIVLLLSESHASIHTYPEHAACFVDLFTCGSACNPEAFDRVLREYLRPKNVVIDIHDRGIAAPELPARLRSANG